jgi:hypothetical protein
LDSSGGDDSSLAALFGLGFVYLGFLVLTHIVCQVLQTEGHLLDALFADVDLVQVEADQLHVVALGLVSLLVDLVDRLGFVVGRSSWVLNF